MRTSYQTYFDVKKIINKRMMQAMEIDLEKEALRLRLIRCLEAATLLYDECYIDLRMFDIVNDDILLAGVKAGIPPSRLKQIDGDDREDSDREF